VFAPAAPPLLLVVARGQCEAVSPVFFFFFASFARSHENENLVHHSFIAADDVTG